MRRVIVNVGAKRAETSELSSTEEEAVRALQDAQKTEQQNKNSQRELLKRIETLQNNILADVASGTSIDASERDELRRLLAKI